MNRRDFLTVAAAAGTAVAAKAQDIKVDGGLAPLIDKMSPERKGILLPPGSLSVRNFTRHCTSCQLCVASCPNGVLKPGKLEDLLQPRMGYENGFCRPECTVCADICPSGAILPISRDEKTAIRIGTARVSPDLCLAAKGEEGCGNCVRHCPSGAISMVKDEKSGHRRPAVNEEQCTGCGACEFLCPVRPLSAITVDGLSTHQKK